MKGKIVVFAGAGISKDKPSNLPSWWDYNKYVLDAIQQEASTAFLSDKPFYSSEEMLEKLPVTSISDVLFKCGMGMIYFNLVSCLEGTRPNMNHFILANMAKNGHLSCVVTTNFDTLIERAFDELKVPYKVLIEEEDYTLDIHEETCLIVKLHGSVNSTETLIDTVTQKMKGLTDKKKELLRVILCEYPSYVIGMSGEDLRFDYDYFQFLSSNTRQKITWVKHPKGNLSPRVSQLSDRMDLVIVEDEIQNMFHDYIPVLSDTGICLGKEKEETDISEKISECVSSDLVGPYVCMGIVLLLLNNCGNTIKTTKICQSIIDFINNNPAVFYQPSGGLIAPLLHNMGIVLIESGNIELAIETIQRSISIQDYNYSKMQELYPSYDVVLKNKTSAIPLSTENLEAEHRRNEGNDYINLGGCYLKRREKGDLDKASECFQNALYDFVAAKNEEGINLAKSLLSEVDFNRDSFEVFHNTEEEYNKQVNKYFDTVSLAQQNGDFETYVNVSCLLAKLLMEYGEYGTAAKVISSLETYMEINISIASKTRYHEIKAEWYIRHNMEEECQQEIEDAFTLLEESGDDIYLKRNLCLCEVRLLGHSFKCLDYTKKCLAYLKDNQDIKTIDRYYDAIPLDKAISIVNKDHPIFRAPFFYEMKKDYLKEKSKVLRAAIIRATFYNDKEILVLLFEQLVSECLRMLDISDACRICFAYVEASRRLTGGIYKYESTYTLICCLNQSGLDEDGNTSLKYIEDVLKSDDADEPEYREIVGNLYAGKANRLLLKGDYQESEKSFIVAREKLCHDDALWQTQVNDRVHLLMQLGLHDRVRETLLLSYPDKSEDEIEAMCPKIKKLNSQHLNGNLRFDGIYCNFEGNNRHVFRFYEDGTVISATVSGAFPKASWFDKGLNEFLSIGKYTLSDKISFSTEVKANGAIIDYNGSVYSDGIVLSSHSHCTGFCQSDIEYAFYSFEEIDF
jgi:tetratricopeptide (TPR) repeat protein/NAD-dependent SIR2 family protein deacetylase